MSRDPGADEAVRTLAAAAWSMVVSQQAASPGWSMSKRGYADTLREAVEPFLLRDDTGDVTGFAPTPVIPAEPAPRGPVLRQFIGGEWVPVPRPWWPALVRLALTRKGHPS